MGKETNGKNTKYLAENHIQSQFFAIDGLKLIIRNERNFRIHLISGAMVVIAGIILGFQHQDWVAVSLLIGLVLIAEAFNSVIEALSDSISLEYRVNIKYAKDVSAGAVLISALVSVIAGAIIFYPYVLRFLQTYLI
jgi:diacylglycerol kinase (ATP)